MLLGEREVRTRVDHDIHGSGNRAAAAVPEDDNEFQAAAEMVDGIAQASEHFAAEAISRDSDHEEVVRSLVENQFDGHARIGTTEHRGEGRLLGRTLLARLESEIARVDRDDLRAIPPIRVPALEEGRNRPASLIETLASRFRGRGPDAGRGAPSPVPIGNLDDLHPDLVSLPPERF